MGRPPFDAGAVQVTAALASPGTATTIVGAPGMVAGVTAAEGVDAGLAPVALVAVTVKVYESPFVRPETVQLVAPDVEQVSPPLRPLV